MGYFYSVAQCESNILLYLALGECYLFYRFQQNSIV